MKFAEWAESWKFTNDSLSDVVDKWPFLSEWADSWKSLLTSYSPMNGPMTNKGWS